ncbi:hypothetical protein FCIRC_5230 [Fusarium circinatum]|uniref:Uncharacterized protein n=1 Tax=Fusarium circinatum TaxID=48490 RepID=A0A8H5U6S0_FUSCI|nr:hypothetical protein FCIRC_5230 [Fusarium circinatum]
MTPGTPELLSASESSRKSSRRNVLGRALDRLHQKSRNTAAEDRPEVLHDDANPGVVFWPVDLLSKDFPDARILLFGYDSKITKYSAGAVSENSVFSHAKDLLFALALERPLHRPLICVAHSLGGIIFKEMLSRSSSSTRREHQDILESVEAVIFLGTPHRGSVDIAAKGEVARSLLTALGVATTPVILDSLGLKNTDLERAQEEFSRLWHTSNLRVKTFQEGLIFPKFGKKVVPEYSSLLGNYREHAETLQADHLEMCRHCGFQPSIDDTRLWVPLLSRHVIGFSMMKSSEIGSADEIRKDIKDLSGSKRCYQDIWDAKVKTGCSVESGAIAWQEAELRTAFEKMMLQKASSKALLFIDALDECDSSSVRNLAYFWRKITKSAFASGIDLKVCLSSRHSPSVTVSDCPEIVMEQHNSDDISTYLKQRIEIGISIKNAQWQILEKKIREMSDGMFLWVVLVVDDLLRSWDEGRSLEYLTKRVENTPQALETLFSEMFSHITPEGKNVAVKLLQWVTLSTKPLRLHEWHQIMGFIRHPTPASLAESRASEYFTATDEQLVKQIKTVSLGLVEVTGAIKVPPLDSGSDISILGAGLELFDPCYGTGHLSIMATCLDYINIGELDALVEARQRVAHQGGDKNEGQSSASVAESNSDCSPSLCSAGREENPPQGTITLPLRRKRTSEDDGRPVQIMSDLPDSYPFMAIHRWLEESSNSTAESELLIDVPQAPSSDISDTFHSQCLEDHPALLSYAAFAMFEHARLAHIDGADLSPILERLNDESTWARWKSLREDVPNGLELLDFLKDLGLVSWISAFQDRFSRGQKRRRSSPPSKASTQRSSLSSSHQLSGDEKRSSTFPGPISLPQVESQQHPPSLGPPKWGRESLQSLNRIPSRQGSVASFSSASSHDGYDLVPSRFESPRPVNSKPVGGTKVVGFFMCECCPKKPKKFNTVAELE